jgi:replicative DNA helicase
VLGVMLRHNDAIPAVAELLRADHFYAYANRLLFTAVVALHADGRPADLVTLADEVKRRGWVEEVGGYGYLAELWDAAPTAANVESYAAIVRDRAQARGLLHYACDMQARALDGRRPAGRLMEEARAELARLEGGGDTRPRFEFIDSAAFAAADYRREWLVRGLLARDEAAVLGGPYKGLKTSMLLDLAVSCGTATPFLGHFPVDKRVRVGFMSGESGGATLQNTARRVCRKKGVSLADATVRWEFTLPQLADPAHLAAVQADIRRYGLEVLIIDPLYLSLLSGTAAEGKDAANLFDMGPLLLAVAQTCLAAGCTPILAHHYKLGRVDHYAEPELLDLAYRLSGKKSA